MVAKEAIVIGFVCLQEAEYKRKLKAKRKQRDGLEADLGAGRGATRSAVRGRARRGHMDSPGDV